MKRLVIALAIFSWFSAFSQTEQRITYELQDLIGQFSYGSGNILISSDKQLPDIVKAYVNYLHKKPIRGWRVQIYFAAGRNARKQAEKVMRQFQSSYPEIPAYLLFEQPYFKVRVGNFTSKSEAAKFLFIIKSQFPKAFLTEDNIDVGRLTD